MLFFGGSGSWICVLEVWQGLTRLSGLRYGFAHCREASSGLTLVTRIGFGVHSTIVIIRSPPKPYIDY